MRVHICPYLQYNKHNVSTCLQITYYNISNVYIILRICDICLPFRVDHMK